MMNQSIFRQYDIRGLIDEDLTHDVVKNIGKSFGSYVIGEGHKNVVVGNDVRPSSSIFHDIIIEALLSSGCNVYDIGTMPISAYYFSINHYKIDGGIYITGSHNPPKYNGFKMNVGNESLFGYDIQKLKDMIIDKKFVEGNGKLTLLNPITDYRNNILGNMELDKKIKIVVDCGNGTNSLMAPDLLRDAGCDVIELYCEPDGTFPNHMPDPTIPENLQQLIRTVVTEHADFGVSYDGDGDRIGVVDDRGNILWGDRLMILFSREILSKHPGSKILVEVKCSQSLIDDIKSNGGNPILCKTGHSLIKNEMKKQKALLAGEMSGHIFFSDEYLGFDDAMYATLRLARILSKSDKRLSEMFYDVKQYYSTPEIRVDCDDNRKFEIVNEVRDYFSKNYKIIDIDGARILFDGGWALVRASNTEPKLILRFESETKTGLEKIRKIVEDKLGSYR